MRSADQAEGLRGTVRAPAHFVPGGPDARRMIAVTSGKGGVGKTQISANLATELGRRGRRVLLVDADLGLASLDLALGLRPLRTLRHVLSGENTVDEVLCRGDHGVTLLAACPGRYEMANLDLRDRGVLFDVIDRIRDRFDVVIIDTGAGIGSNAVAFASRADQVLLVATPDPASLRDAYAMTKVLHRRSGVHRIELVTNQIASEREGLDIYERLQGITSRFLRVEIGYLGAIPRDHRVREGVRTGHPFVTRHVDCAASRAIARIAKRVDITTRELEVS